jgi:hypothetical protein
MYRISRDGQEPIIDVDQVEAIKPAIRSSEPGRYDVDEISANLLPIGHSSKRWGAGIKHGDDELAIEPESFNQ